MDDNRKKALEAALGQIERQFGKGAIMRLGDPSVMPDIDVVSTGSLQLDVALGVGGLPRGRVVEIYGPEASGKTTLTLEVIAQMQKAGSLDRSLANLLTIGSAQLRWGVLSFDSARLKVTANP